MGAASGDYLVPVDRGGERREGQCGPTAANLRLSREGIEGGRGSSGTTEEANKCWSCVPTIPVLGELR